MIHPRSSRRHLLWTCALALGLPAFTACDSDSDSPSGSADPAADSGPGQNPDQGDGGGQITLPDATAGEPSYPDCDRDSILAPPTWDLDEDGMLDAPPATEAEVDACFMACDPLTQACVDSDPACATFSDFNLCLNLVAGNCAAQPTEAITCYDEWQTYNCCIDANCPPEVDLGSCIGTFCSGEADEYFECVDGNETCIRRGISTCIAPDAMEGDGGTEVSSCSCACDCADMDVADVACTDTAEDCCDSVCGLACTGNNGAFVGAERTCQ